MYVGASIIVAGVDATFNGTVTVLAIPEYLFIGVDDDGDLLYNYEVPVPFQILYAKTAANVTRTTATGTVTLGTIPCTWITAGQVEDWLGIGTASALDTTFLTQCAAAANDFCFQRRLESASQIWIRFAFPIIMPVKYSRITNPIRSVLSAAFLQRAGARSTACSAQ